MNPEGAGSSQRGRGNKALLLLGAALLALVPTSNAAPSPALVMPAPAKNHSSEGRLRITSAVTFAVSGVADLRIQTSLSSMVHQWELRTGYGFGRTAQGERAFAGESAVATITIQVAALADPIPSLDDNESYSLEVTPDGVVLSAVTSTGALRGVATLTQMLQSDHEGWFISCGTIEDSPRFAWRGLLIDPARHWIPVEAVKRTLDGMALVKLNVLHLHLTDDQGFRIESKKYPRLHQLGSDGHYYTHDQIRDLIAYAAARGIRVVPEFDMPGHATTWVLAYPALGSGTVPTGITRVWGVLDVVLDPTNEDLYTVLDVFFGEIAALFPDDYLHIGGDENNGKQWTANARIQAFMRARGLKDNAALQAYFNRRLQSIVAKHGKKMIGWDEILHAELPPGTVIQSWRGVDDMANAARLGFAAILSRGYYLDHMLIAAQYYANDPTPKNVSLTPEQQKLLLGGEACMWGEWVTADTLDSRIWPRAAAIAERLWSPRAVNDVADMYRRLEIVSQRLEEAGLKHISNREAMLRQFAGSPSSATVQEKLRVLSDLFAAGSNRIRWHLAPDVTQFTPLTGFADCAVAESPLVRAFARDVHRIVSPSGIKTADALTELARSLAAWQSLGDELAAGKLAPDSPRICDLAPLGRTLVDAVTIGRSAIDDIARGGSELTLAQQRLKTLTAIAQPQLGVTLPILTPLRQLVAAAALEQKGAHLKPEEWSAEIEKLAALPTTERN